jgi:Cytochrome P460
VAAFDLLDRSGRIVLVREGEGHARELEAAIRTLLSLAPSGIVAVPGDDPDLYSATEGWGFGRFINGKPADEAQHQTCFACHSANVRDHDFVFTRFAP